MILKEEKGVLVIQAPKKAVGFLKIIRPINLLIIGISFFIGFTFVSKPLEYNLPLVYLLIAASGYVINDVLDFDADKINNPERVLPSRLLSQKEAKIIFLALVSVFFILNFSYNLKLFFFNNLVFLLVFGYSYYFKKKILVGNLLVSFFTASPFIAVAIRFSDFNSLKELIIFSFLINFIREIVKDFEDIKGDLHVNGKSFPIVFGEKKSFNFLFILLIIFFIISVLFYQGVSKKIFYLIFIIVLVNGNNFISIYLTKIHKYGIASKILKLNIFLGIGGLWLSN